MSAMVDVAARIEARRLLEAGDIAGACLVWQRHVDVQPEPAVRGTIGFANSGDLVAYRKEEIERYFSIGPRTIAIELAIETLFGKGPNDRDTRLLSSCAAFIRDLSQYRESGFVVGLVVKESPAGSCHACKEIVGCWPIDKVPQVPNPRCAHEDGCLCWWIPIFEDESPPSPWRA